MLFVTLTLTDDSVTELTDDGRSEVRWADIIRVDAGRHYTFVYSADKGAVIIPHCRCESDDQYRAAQEFILDRFKSHGRGQS